MIKKLSNLSNKRLYFVVLGVPLIIMLLGEMLSYFYPEVHRFKSIITISLPIGVFSLTYNFWILAVGVELWKNNEFLPEENYKMFIGAMLFILTFNLVSTSSLVVIGVMIENGTYSREYFGYMETLKNIKGIVLISYLFSYYFIAKLLNSINKKEDVTFGKFYFDAFLLYMNVLGMWIVNRKIRTALGKQNYHQSS